MRVTEIWRHPVKSFRGEPLEEATITLDGLHGDRYWGVRDDELGKMLTARREPVLLTASARLHDELPVVTLPDGTELAGPGDTTDRALSNWLGRPVRLVDVTESGETVAEFFADATDDSSPMIEWTLPPTRFVDGFPLLVLTTASLAAGHALYPDGNWDSRRFRPNIVIEVDDEGFVEDNWQGRQIAIGDVVIDVTAPCPRCTMVTRPQPDLDRDVDIYRTLARHHNHSFGMWSGVSAEGAVRVGDEVTLVG